MWPASYLITPWDWLPERELVCPRVKWLLRLPDVLLVPTFARVNGTTPARRAISTSPTCQCIASTALHGRTISSAIFAHISDLNLVSAG